MFDKFRKLKPESGAAEIGSTVEETKEALAVAKAEHAALVASRGPLLLNGTDADVSKLEAETAAMARNIERLELAVTELEKRRDEAQSREEEAALLARLAADQADSEKGIALLQEYDKMAAALAELLAELSAIDRRIRAGNAQREEARRPERAKRPQGAVTAEGHSGGLSYREIQAAVVLPKATKSSQNHWPAPAHSMPARSAGDRNPSPIPGPFASGTVCGGPVMTGPGE